MSSAPHFHATMLAGAASFLACGSPATAPDDEVAVPFVSVSVGPHACGLTAAGSAYCWGLGGAPRPSPVRMPAGVSFTRISVGSPTCALNAAGEVFCWEEDLLNQEPTPVVAPAGVTFADLSGGPGHVCATSHGGAVYCWGDNEFGQLGDGTTQDRLAPTEVLAPAGVRFTRVSASWYFTCAVSDQASAYCWGANWDGELGDGTTTDRLTPVALAMPPGVGVAMIGAGRGHGCALSDAGTAYCWGYNAEGRLGDGTPVNRLSPVPVLMPPGVTFSALTVTWDHACGVTPAAEPYCWGRNTFGSLGDGTTSHRTSPVPVLMPTGVTFPQVSAGWNRTCALTPAGAAYCWGLNSDGGLGIGTTDDQLVPARVLPP